MVKTSSSLENKYTELEDVYESFDLPDFPYSCKLSFDPLFRFWKNQLKSSDLSNLVIAREIQERIKGKPALQGIISNVETLNKNKELVDLLLSAFFPASRENKEYIRISGPFGKFPFFQTPSLEQIDMDPNSTIHFKHSEAQDYTLMISIAGNLILHRCYDYPILHTPKLPFSLSYKDSPIERFFQAEIDLSFVEVKVKGELPPITQEKVEHLMKNFGDTDRWLKFFPPENFAFEGLVSTYINEVTESETLSELKHLLLDQNTFLDHEKTEKLRDKLRTLFNLPDLDFGISAIDYPMPSQLFHKHWLKKALLDGRYKKWRKKLFPDSIYEEILKHQSIRIIEDIECYPDQCKFLKALINEGWNSIMLIPLTNTKNKIIGLLEIASPQKYGLNSFAFLKINDLATLFSIAVERNRDEMNNLIDSIIREEYTSLHPSVEWRFKENALTLFKNREKKDLNSEIAPIIFKDVYPLYGQADIAASSGVRNDSIQSDLIENLQEACKVLKVIKEQFYVPLVDQYITEIKEHIEDVSKGVTSSNEYKALHLIKKELHGLFRDFMSRDLLIKDAGKAYFDKLDPELHIFYKKRKAYEQSVSRINRVVSSYLDQEQEHLQSVVPHYYEKYETDGVAYNIYTGESLLKKGDFTIHQLQNLRLWQLKSMCEITRKIAELRKELPIPLTTAQLVLVHSSPLSIRFRMDEKRFDVDGTYNVRYEIIKKRIDKAYVEGKEERLTLSGKIAIAYQHEEDRIEYLRYIHYLVEEGYITDEVEELNLTELQGVQGLKALRITVREVG